MCTTTQYPWMKTGVLDIIHLLLNSVPTPQLLDAQRITDLFTAAGIPKYPRDGMAQLPP